MARYTCQRRACGMELHTTDEPHLCKDIARRQARQQAQLDAVEHVLVFHHVDAHMGDAEFERTKEDIVRALNRLGVTSDA